LPVVPAVTFTFVELPVRSGWVLEGFRRVAGSVALPPVPVTEVCAGAVVVPWRPVRSLLVVVPPLGALVAVGF